MLTARGHDARHTLDLQMKNQTSDETLRQLAGSEERVLVTKDADFVDSFLLRGLPQRLLFVTTGNLPNDDLLALFQTNLPAITGALSSHSFVEIDRSGLTVHS